jgi:hypothetical protein
MKYSARGAAAALLIVLGGCTTSLSTRPDFARTDSHGALRGISYALPMLQYEIKASYKIVDCPRPPLGADPGGKMDLIVEATATSDYVAGERYVINYAALANKLKTTDFTIETHPGSGTLKSLNASAEDKTGDAIKSVVETAISGASMAAGAPVAIGQGSSALETTVDAFISGAKVTKQTLICTDDAKNLAVASAKARERIKVLIILLDQGGKTADTIAVRATLKLGKATDGDDLLKLHEDQLARAKELTELQTLLAGNDAKLSFVETVRWPQAFDTQPGKITSTALFKAWADKWLDVDTTTYDVTDPKKLKIAIEQRRSTVGLVDGGVIPLLEQKLVGITPDAGCDVGEQASDCARRQLGLYASLETGHAEPEACPETGPDKPCLVSTGFTAARDATPDKGIFVREPIRARLVLCDHDSACADSVQKPIFEGSMVMAPQRGQLRFLPFSNGAFQNNALGVTLRTDGGIDKMQYSEKSAIVAGALASISASASKVDEYLKKREEERDKAVADARAEAIAARADAKGIRDEELAQLQYQFDKTAKEKAKFDQDHPTIPEPPAVAKELANENLELQAELTRLTQLIGIKKAVLEYAGLQ